MDFKNVTVAGGGVLGSQIAYQTAFKGFSVVVYDIDSNALAQAQQRIQGLMERYQEDLGSTQDDVKAAYGRIAFRSDLTQAVSQADLVIEAIPEVAAIKTDFYKKLGQVAPNKTIFATNSSTLLPSQFAEMSGRPTKFLALHFANMIWKNNTAEIMGHAGTDPQVFSEVAAFARAIGMVVLPLHKEQPGYILNSLLIPFLNAAQMLLVNDVADVETIDKTWMIATGAPLGPFAILDVVGINTAYNITLTQAQSGNPAYEKLAQLLKTQYIDQGKLGQGTGAGFYTYPHPHYLDPDFLKN